MIQNTFTSCLINSELITRPHLSSFREQFFWIYRNIISHALPRMGMRYLQGVIPSGFKLQFVSLGEKKKERYT